jgi:capsular exopolysaccharide synthesis family protein
VEIDLRVLMRAAWRWAWLIVLITVVFGGIGYAISVRQATSYEATVQILINPEQSTGATELSTLQASRDQAETYRLLLQSTPVLDRVVKTLDLPYSSSALSENITTKVLRDTQLIEVTVKDPSAEQAATLANTLTEQFKAHVQELTVARYKSNLANLEQQTADLESRRTEIDKELAGLESGADAQDSVVQRQISDLKDERTRVSQTIADVDASIRAANRSIATTYAPVEVANPAEVPAVSSGPRTMLGTVAGLFLGLIVAAVAVALLELLDKSVRRTDDIVELTGSPILASIAKAPGGAGADERIFAGSPARASAMEAIRLLRTNLLLATANDSLKTFVVSSPGDGEGKSTITANLGIAMAQAGHKTVIVDADLRRPSQHEIFGLPNASGLTSLLSRLDQPWTQAANGTSIPGLTVITAGPNPDTAVDLLDSDRLAGIIERIRQDADVVLFDTAPMLAYSDALAVGAHSDAILLVARPGHTSSDGLHAAAMGVHQGGIRLVGVVMNRVKKASVSGGYGRSRAALAPPPAEMPSPQPAQEGRTG